MKILN